MADALSKVNLLSFESQRLSVFPRNSNLNFSGYSSRSLRLDSDGFRVKRLVHRRDDCSPRRGVSRSQFSTIKAQTSFAIGKAQKWWEKDLKSNMKEVESAQELVDSLKKAGDKLVVVGFFSPSCGGCKALHPKLCQIAEMNPGVQFLQVNYEEHKSMCYSLSVHVLPFFRFYRGAHGRLCSFSCTNATIKKFREALAKHSTDRCSIAPVKGLEERELVALASNRDLAFSYTPEPVKEAQPVPGPIFHTLRAVEAPSPAKLPLSISGQDSESRSVAVSER